MPNPLEPSHELANKIRDYKKAHCWEEFEKWCKKSSVNMTYEYEWKPWWDCWCKAIDYFIKIVLKEISTEEKGVLPPPLKETQVVWPEKQGEK